MKVAIFCGGRGTRLSEETGLKPKPMVTIGELPILSHIMSIYRHHGFNEFLLALGYKGNVIKEYFLNVNAFNSDFEIDLSSGDVSYHNRQKLDWKVGLIDTGEDTMTGGRLLRLKKYLNPTETFMLTYGDGVSNVNLKDLLAFHKSHGKLMTVTAVRPMARFGGLVLNDNKVSDFREKPELGEGWINGGFFVCEPGVLDYIKDDSTIFERSPMERLARDNQLMAFRHDGFWQCMDTLRERELLEEMWMSKKAPWRVWD